MRDDLLRTEDSKRNPLSSIFYPQYSGRRELRRGRLSRCERSGGGDGGGDRHGRVEGQRAADQRGDEQRLASLNGVRVGQAIGGHDLLDGGAEILGQATERVAVLVD